MPILRPLIQTGMQTMLSTQATTPTAGPGRRVVRTAEERTAHRMAKNRATAAASRYYFGAMHMYLQAGKDSSMHLWAGSAKVQTAVMHASCSADGQAAVSWQPISANLTRCTLAIRSDMSHCLACHSERRLCSPLAS